MAILLFDDGEKSGVFTSWYDKLSHAVDPIDLGSISTGGSRISLHHQTVGQWIVAGGILLLKGKLCEVSGKEYYSCKWHHTPCGIAAWLFTFRSVRICGLELLRHHMNIKSWLVRDSLRSYIWDMNIAWSISIPSFSRISNPGWLGRAPWFIYYINPY